jgi:membrane-associated protease RseP (regulator of RpoE activity)
MPTPIRCTVAFALLASGGLWAQEGPILQAQNRDAERPADSPAAPANGFVLPPAPGERAARPSAAQDDADLPRTRAERDVLPPAPDERLDAGDLPPSEPPAESAERALEPNRENYLGVITDPLPAALAAQFSDTLGEAAGLLVRSVRPGSAAERAGLSANDILVSYNGEPLSSPDDLKRLVITDEPGASVDLALIRAAQPETVTLTLGQRALEAAPSREPRRIASSPRAPGQPAPRPPAVDIRLPGRRSIIVDRHGLVTPWIAVEWGSPLAGRRFQALTPDGRQFEVEVRVHPDGWNRRRR